MTVDQEWAQENIDIIVKIFKRINRQESNANISYHKKQMLKDMDKVMYRGYYDLARRQEKEKVQKAKTIGDKQERRRMDEIIDCNSSNTERAIDLLEEQLDEKDNQIKKLTNLLNEKDRKIENLLEKIMERLDTPSILSRK